MEAHLPTIRRAVCKLGDNRCAFLCKVTTKDDATKNWPREPGLDGGFYGLITTSGIASSFLGSVVELSREYADHADIVFKLDRFSDVNKVFTNKEIDVTIYQLSKDTRVALEEIGFKFLELPTSSESEETDAVAVHYTDKGPLVTVDAKMTSGGTVELPADKKDPTQGTPIISKATGATIALFLAPTFCRISTIMAEVAEKGGFNDIISPPPYVSTLETPPSHMLVTRSVNLPPLRPLPSLLPPTRSSTANKSLFETALDVHEHLHRALHMLRDGELRYSTLATVRHSCHDVPDLISEVDDVIDAALMDEEIESIEAESLERDIYYPLPPRLPSSSVNPYLLRRCHLRYMLNNPCRSSSFYRNYYDI